MRACFLVLGMIGAILHSASIGVADDAGVGKLRAAVEDLVATYGDRYPGGAAYLARLDAIEQRLADGDSTAAGDLETLRSEALLANPLLTESPGVLLVKRAPMGASLKGLEIGMPSNHECNSSLERTGWDNEICRLSPLSPKGQLTTVYRPSDGGYVGEMDLNFDGDRLLFTKSDATNWKLFEMTGVDAEPRPVTRFPEDVDAMDGCYLPSGKIVLGTTASYQSVPCWHGQRRVTNLYTMDADGSNARQLCFDQDHDLHPVVLPSGQVLYSRWDYTGICHIFMRQLMTMNPDGTKQRAIYGSNSWFPNSLYFARPIPGGENRLIAILSGYHGVHRMGQLVVVDPSVGWADENGLVQRISGRGDPIDPKVNDVLVDADWPKFLHPFPLSDKHFLVSAWLDKKGTWGIYLADVFDNLVLVHETPGYALLEPTPLSPRPTPPVIPEQVVPGAATANVYLNDVYVGPGLAGVPRGTVKSLRLIAYDFGYPGLAGSDKIGFGGPWEAMRILGTVPVEVDGSASFSVPANTPLSIQPLDEQGRAVQLMRSWFTAMPGEQVSCIGCHESPREAGLVRRTIAATRRPDAITPWRGPARGFDFEREVQPVLDRYCVSCHDGSEDDVADLRSEKDGGVPTPKPIGYVSRLHPDMRKATGGRMTYSPAYDVLVHYIRRVGVEDDVSLLTPGEYHADTSELVQMLRDGHHGVSLDGGAWDRIHTWIDMNGPCHGTWGDVFPIPDGVHERRLELRALYGGPTEDPETIHETSLASVEPVTVNAASTAAREPMTLDGWPLTKQEAAALGGATKTLDLGDGVTMDLVRVPAGRFVMGDAADGSQRVVTIDKSFWMGRCEVTNAQFRRFDPSHDSGYYNKRRDRADGQGLSFNGDDQPVVRVSREAAGAFCAWLSDAANAAVALPTEERWEYACRAGGATPMHFGDAAADFSRWENLADKTFSTGVLNAKGGMMPEGGATQVTGGVPHLLLEGAELAETRFDDRQRVTSDVGSFAPNAWGLCDMHGNAAEWTASDDAGRAIVRGGSFFDRPERATATRRTAYPAWRRVFNVGFRVVVEE